MRAVGVGEAHRLDHQMRRRRIVGLEPEALQHVEHLDQHHAAGGRRRHRHDVVAAIGAAQHRALDRLVVLQVVAWSSARRLRAPRRKSCPRPGLRRTRAGLAWRWRRSVLARSVCTSSVPRAISEPSGLQEQLRGRRPARHPRDRRAAGVLELVADLVAVARQLDRRRDQLRQLEFAGAVFLQRERQARDGARHADAEALIARFRRIGVALARRGRSRAWSPPARSRDSRWRCRAGPRLPGEMDHHEAAAADDCRRADRSPPWRSRPRPPHRPRCRRA